MILGAIMALNFSFDKAFNDLFSDKNNVLSLICIVLLFGMFDLLFSKHETFSLNLVNILLSGYLSVMANNIIQGHEPVLTNIFNYNDKSKGLALIGFKQIICSVIYYLPPFICGFILLQLISKELTTPIVLLTIFLSFLIIVTSFFASVSSLTLFSETLSFKQSFNITKAVKSFKYVWKEYLFSIIIVNTLFISSCLLTALFQVLFYNLIFVMCQYFSSHLTAQAYKYALSKMDA